MTQTTERTHNTHPSTQDTQALPSVESTVRLVTEINSDINSDEVYEALRVYTEDIAISEADYEATLQRRMESDLHPSCREGNFPTFAEVKGDFIETKWNDGSVTVDNTDYFIG